MMVQLVACWPGTRFITRLDSLRKKKIKHFKISFKNYRNEVNNDGVHCDKTYKLANFPNEPNTS